MIICFRTRDDFFRVLFINQHIYVATINWKHIVAEIDRDRFNWINETERAMNFDILYSYSG